MPVKRPRTDQSFGNRLMSGSNRLSLIRTVLHNLVARYHDAQEIWDSRQVLTLRSWLLYQGLAPLAHARFKQTWPELAEALRGDAYLSALEHALRSERQAVIHRAFAAAGIPIVPLKGAALAHTVYDDPAWRPMTDIDYWVRDEHMNTAINAMKEAGYRVKISWQERPPALQKLLDGEVQFVGPAKDIVELHWSPFSGWWLQHAARIDNEALWERLQPLPVPQTDDQPEQWQLSPEDSLLQLAVHVSVNHKFGIWPVRSLVDIYLVATRNEVDWPELVQRAYRWRLATVLWIVLDLTHQLIGMEESEPVRRALQPSRMRRRLLRQLVPPEQFILDSDMRESDARFALLLLLVDRPSDMLRLIQHMLWPSRFWLQARYGDEHVSNFRHLWRILRHRQM